MSGHLPVRRPGAMRRRTIRRSSRRLDGARALAALVMLASAGGIWGVATSSAFEVSAVDVTGATLTAGPALDAALDLGTSEPNAFAVRTDDIRARLAALPAVSRVEVTVTLAGTLRVRLVEREPVLAWHVGDAILLVDRTGYVVADAGAPGATGAARQLAATLPTVIDQRVAAAAGAGDGTDPGATDGTGGATGQAASPKPSASPKAGASARPGASAKPRASARPAASPRAKASARPASSARPAASARPASSPRPGASVDPGTAGTGPGTGAQAAASPGSGEALGPQAGTPAAGRPTAGDTAAGTATSGPPAPGTTLDPLDLDIATRLLSLGPADVGSAASALHVTVDDVDGWTVRPATGDSWDAVFGFYATLLREPTLIPEQVRLLRSVLIASGEAHIRRIMLADATGATVTTR